MTSTGTRNRSASMHTSITPFGGVRLTHFGGSSHFRPLMPFTPRTVGFTARQTPTKNSAATVKIAAGRSASLVSQSRHRT